MEQEQTLYDLFLSIENPSLLFECDFEKLIKKLVEQNLSSRRVTSILNHLTKLRKLTHDGSPVQNYIDNFRKEFSVAVKAAYSETERLLEEDNYLRLVQTWKHVELTDRLIEPLKRYPFEDDKPDVKFYFQMLDRFRNFINGNLASEEENVLPRLTNNISYLLNELNDLVRGNRSRLISIYSFLFALGLPVLSASLLSYIPKIVNDMSLDQLFICNFCYMLKQISSNLKMLDDKVLYKHLDKIYTTLEASDHLGHTETDKLFTDYSSFLSYLGVELKKELYVGVESEKESN